jgi:hypothetical protein
MRRFKRFLPVLLAGLLLFGFQYVSIKQSTYRLPFPGASQPVSEDCKMADIELLDKPGCICTTKALIQVGFPFRDNYYDACQQDEAIKWHIQVVNWLFQLVVAAGILLLIRRLVRA